MPPSRLDRFKAAVQQDLDKLPDKPTHQSTALQSSKLDENVKLAEPELKEHADTESANKMETDDDPVAPTSDAFSNLTVLDSTAYDSDDSEAGCPIEIIPVTEDEPELEEVAEMVAENVEVSQDTPVTNQGPPMNVAQVTVHGELFCPILAVAKFPYKYVPQADKQAVASAFFDSGQFWRRGWEVFYVWPLEPADKPIILIHEEPFAQLLKEVGRKFRTLHIDPKDRYYRDIKLVTSFPNHPRMLPRYLGRVKSKDEYDNLVFRTPSQSPFAFPRGEPEAARAPSDEEMAEFDDTCEQAVDLARTKPRGGKTKYEQQRIMVQVNLSKQLKRAQRYLGLRKKSDRVGTSGDTSLLPTQEHATMVQQSQGNAIQPLDISEPAPYTFEDDVVIICVDVEAWEKSSSTITEVGIATLDTRDIRSVPPGNNGEQWRKHIRARHFRIHEHMMYENHEFIQGAADRFEKEFGETEIISLKDAARIVASCFKEPFSKPLTEDGINDSWEQLPEESQGNDEPAAEKRNIVFLGHNPAADIQYLQKLGYTPLNLSNLMETMDTASLYRAHKKEQNARSVGGILSEFGLTGWNLHNAGNDAVYTLWIMLATAVAEACSRHKSDDSGDEGIAEDKNKVVSTGGDGSKQAGVPRVQQVEIEIPEEYKRW